MRSALIALGVALLGGCNSILGVHELATGDGGASAACSSDERRACYSGTAATKDVGPCHGGMQSCQADHTWGPCEGEVVPIAEICGNGVDDNCSGTPDENVDQDHDGYSTCGGDCCDSNECLNPGQVNPGAYDVPGNQDKVVLQARDDAASFVASDGRIRGAQLEAALRHLRERNADARRASDLQLAMAILAL